MLDFGRYFRSSTRISRQAICTSWQEACDLIEKRDINLVIWERESDPEIQSFIKDLYYSVFRPVDLVMLSGSVRDQLAALFASDSGIGSAKLRDDIVTLTEYFLKVNGRDLLRLHLRVVEDDACQKFHVDRYALRLICTYDGPGTEWVPDDHVNRKALGTDNNQIVRDPRYINQMHCFHVGMMKGDLQDCRKGNGIVHRSPPVVEKGQKRLVLRLDI